VATDYRFQYMTSDSVWHNWFTAEASTRGGATSGYMQARVPDSAKPIKAFAFQRTTNTAQYREVGNPAGDGIVTGANAFQVLGTKSGGYRWLNGTGTHGSSTSGAWIDNAIADATDYRRVRVTVSPKGIAREVVVSW